jgi:hypothetical protein
MQHAFEQAAEERHLQSGPVFVRFLLGEFIDLLIGAGAEWIAKLTTNSSVRSAATSLNAGRTSLPDEVMEARDRRSMLVDLLVHAIANHDFPAARRFSIEESHAREELRRLREKYNLDARD